MNSVAVLLDASRAATPSDSARVVMADAAVENVNAQVDALITTGILRRVLAFTELQFSNSMIEAWWRSLKQSSTWPKPCPGLERLPMNSPVRTRRELARESAECPWRQLVYRFSLRAEKSFGFCQLPTGPPV